MNTRSPFVVFLRAYFTLPSLGEGRRRSGGERSVPRRGKVYFRSTGPSSMSTTMVLQLWSREPKPSAVSGW